MNEISLYLMVLIYGAAGMLHFIFPKFYENIMPEWLLYKRLLVYLSGVAEAALALLLLPDLTRNFAAWLIILMLIIFFFFIHVPQAILYYKIKHRLLALTLVRLPLQFLLIAWAWTFTNQ